MREMKNSGIEWMGDIPQTWGTIKFKYLHSGLNTGEAIDKEFWSTDENDRIFYTAGLVPIRTTYTDFPEWKLTNNNDLLLARNGTPYVYYPESNSSYTDHIIRAMMKDGVNRRFIQYSIQQSISSVVVETVSIATWSASLWNEQIIAYPTVGEQKRIADYLDCKCAEIDAVIEKTKATIEEYKKLKQSVITEAVTKGIRGDRPMKDSGNLWYGNIPFDWDILKLKYMFRVKKDIAGKEGYTVLSITQRGVMPKNITSNEGQIAENYSNYQLVNPGDFAMNHMDLLTGWVDISKYSGVTSPDYRVFTLLDTTKNYSKYYLYLMQICYTNRIFYGLGQGVSGLGRWRLQADKFLNFTIPVPSYEEQKEIADYLDKKCAEIDTLIAKKTTLLEEMENYKKSVIYEYVTGKKECVSEEDSKTVVVLSPYFPVVLNTDKPRFAQAMLMCRILDKCRTKMGRVKLEKMLYTIENSIGFDFGTEYAREAAGPLDSSIYECERIISIRNKWYTLHSSKYGVSYMPTKKSGDYEKYYNKYFSEFDADIEHIINVFMNYDADQSEIIATLFGAWNDAIIDKKAFTDEDIVDDVLNNWNDSKKRFAKDVWLRAIDQMRKNNIVPKGYGRKTVIK